MDFISMRRVLNPGIGIDSQDIGIRNKPQVMYMSRGILSGRRGKKNETSKYNGKHKT